jgi:N-acetylneuraminic acid mutarotase
VNPVPHPGRAWRRLFLACAALSFISAANSKADAPIITNPADLRFLDYNETLDGLDPIPIWSPRAPMPTSRVGFAITVEDGKIYTIEGKGADTGKCGTIQSVEAYDPVTDTWVRDLAEPTAKRFRCAAAALGGIIYLVGGESREGDVCGLVVATVEAYDPVSNTWTTKAAMPTARTQVSLIADETSNKLYAIGGSNGSQGIPPFVAMATVEIYDPDQDSWSALSDMNTARTLPNLGLIGGKIYAAGGQDANHIGIDTVEDYDLSTGQWTLHQSVSSIMPLRRLNPGTAVLGEKIYVAGGEDEDLTSDPGPKFTVQVYDPTTDSWSTSIGNPVLPALPSGRRNLGCAVVDDLLYALGGEAPNAVAGQEFTYQITATNDPVSYSSTTLPPGLALVDPILGLITGTPTEHENDFQVTFSATNANSETGSKVVSFYILPTPTPTPNPVSIVSRTCATARTGEPFTFQVLTSGASSEAVLTASGLPYAEGVGPELTIDSATGLISGTVSPSVDDTPQSFGVSLLLTDANGTRTAQSFLQLTFITEPIPTVPIINSASNVTLALNKFFSYTITADAPADSFDFIDEIGTLNGTLPSGLTFDPTTHTISGIYTGEPTTKPSQGHLAQDSIETIKKEPPPKIEMCGNSQSSGTNTGVGPLNFIPSLHDDEVEALGIKTSRATEYAVFTNDPLASGTGAGLLKSTQIGQFITYTVPVAAAGTYDVRVGVETNNENGIFQLFINGVSQGGPQDEYSALMGHDLRELGPHKFKAGDSSFKFQVTNKNPLSGGYQLVFDYIDLVPRGETERLAFTSSVSNVRLRDANFSGGLGEMLRATTVGDFVSYTVPVNVAGFYDVKVATRTGTANGIFQLAIDGVNLGYAQDEYAATTGYPVLNLGTIFLDQGNKTFKFSVTGRNASSTGDALVFDYIDLVLSSQDEAETLPVSGTTTISTITDPVLSGGKGLLLKARAANNSMTFTVPIPEAGTYTIKAGSRTGNKSGKFQLLIDGVNQGSVQDQYSALTAYQVYDLGTITFTGSGDSAFQFLVTDKNPSSTGYQLLFDYIELVR